VAPLWCYVDWYKLLNRIPIVGNRPMEKIESLRLKVRLLEDSILHRKDSHDEFDLYELKKKLLEFKYLNPENIEIDYLISLMDSLEDTYEKVESKKMNHKLNLLTIWSTIFLPLSFYTGMWGMNFDDVPLISDDDGFWIFTGLSVITMIGMFTYFKRNKWY
jgi:Mg2+ and Co2+ transporter CorA